MSIRYELAEFYDDTLDRTQDFGFQVADQTRRSLCSLWQNLPGALIPNPGDSFRRGALSALCQDFPPPPAPSAPFLGGQCPTPYFITVRRAFRNKATNAVVDQSGLVVGSRTGPISQERRRVGDNISLFISSASNPDEQTFGFNAEENDLIFLGIDGITRNDGLADNCGNPEQEFPGGDIINEGDQIFEGDTIVEGDRNIPITIDFSPTFEDEVCIGQFVFCADVEGNRVTLDAGGITINLPGTGGGDSGGGVDQETGDTITNIDNRTTIIQQQQEECCAAIIQSISSFRNRATELFNEAELRDACIVGLIRNAAPKFPKFEDPISQRASGFSGQFGIVDFVQPSRADSCFLVIDIEPTETFRGRIYALRDESEDVEGGFGHVEVSFFDGGVRPASEAGIRVISSRRTLITFPYITSGNQIRLSLKGGLNYSVVDPGFRWRPLELPQCDEIVDPTP